MKCFLKWAKNKINKKFTIACIKAMAWFVRKIN